MEFNSIHHFFSQFHSPCSHPLFSTIVTLHTSILLYAPSLFLYAPSLFLRIVLSPVLNSTVIILLFLLKLGANERLEQESNHSEPRVVDHKDKHYEQLSLDSGFGLDSTSLEQRFLALVDRNQTESKSHQMKVEFERDLGLESNFKDAYSMESTQVVEKEEIGMEMNSNEVDATIEFLKWNTKAPLEIIYEAYEGEEEDDDDDDSNGINLVSSDKHVLGLERYPSLSIYYPESETDSSSDDDFLMNRNWESHENVFPDWEDDDREELIEISVDRYKERKIEFFRAEEDNLIEIDIFPTRY